MTRCSHWRLWWIAVVLVLGSALAAQPASNLARQDLEQAFQFEREGKISQGLASFNAAYRADPRVVTPDGWRLASRLLTTLRNLDNALWCAQKADAAQHDWQAVWQLCAVLEQREDYQQARAVLRSALPQAGRSGAWPYDQLLAAVAQFYRSTSDNPIAHDAIDGEMYLQLARARHKAEFNILSFTGLVAAYVDLGRYAEARAQLATWIKAGRPGDAGQKQELERLLDEAGIDYECLTFGLGAEDARQEMRDWHRKAGVWDIMVPGRNGIRQTVVLLTNSKSWTETVDAGENRWLHVAVADSAQAVEVRIVSKYVSIEPPLAVDAAGDYTVPDSYQRFLRRSFDGQIDPTTPLARSIAASLKRATPQDTFRAVWWWWTTNVQYAGVESKEEWMDQSENTLRQRRGVCNDMAQAACALLRANGLAARLVRGPGHSWAEVWMPRSGWLPFQNGARLGRGNYRPLGGVCATASPDGARLSWDPGANSEVLWSTPGVTHTRLALLTEDVPIEKVIADAKLPGTLVK